MYLIRDFYEERTRNYYSSVIKRQTTNFFQGAKALHGHLSREDTVRTKQHTKGCSVSSAVRETSAAPGYLSVEAFILTHISNTRFQFADPRHRLSDCH